MPSIDQDITVVIKADVSAFPELRVAIRYLLDYANRLIADGHVTAGMEVRRCAKTIMPNVTVAHER